MILEVFYGFTLEKKRTYASWNFIVSHVISDLPNINYYTLLFLLPYVCIWQYEACILLHTLAGTS